MRFFGPGRPSSTSHAAGPFPANTGTARIRRAWSAGGPEHAPGGDKPRTRRPRAVRSQLLDRDAEASPLARPRDSPDTAGAHGFRLSDSQRDGCLGISTQYHPRISPSSNPTARSAGYRSASSARIAVLNFSGRPVAARALRALGDRADDAHLVSQVDGKSSDILHPSAGVLLDDGRRPGSGCIRRIAKPIARPPGRHALLLADPLTDASRIDVAGFDRQQCPALFEPGVQFPQERVMHRRDDEIGARNGWPQFGRGFCDPPCCR